MVNPKLVVFGVLAIGAAVATAVTAAWAGYKTAEKVQNAPEDKKPKTKTETVKETWKYWVPSAVCLTVAIVSDVCLFKFGAGAAAALSSVVGTAYMNRKKINEKLKKVMDSKEFKEFKKDMTKESVKERFEVKEFNVQETNYGDTLCYFELIDKWFRSSPMEIQRALKTFKWNVMHNSETTLLSLIDDLHIQLKDFEKYAYKDLGWFQDLDIGDDFDYIDCEMLEGFVPGFPEETYVITTWYEPIVIEAREVA